MSVSRPVRSAVDVVEILYKHYYVKHVRDMENEHHIWPHLFVQPRYSVLVGKLPPGCAEPDLVKALCDTACSCYAHPGLYLENGLCARITKAARQVSFVQAPHVVICRCTALISYPGSPVPSDNISNTLKL